MRDFRLRFFASESMWQPPQEVGDLHSSREFCGLMPTHATRNRRARQHMRCSRTDSSMQAADAFLKGVLTEAAKDVHSQPVPDVMAMLRQGVQGRIPHATEEELSEHAQ
jgi:hypothetical protein